MGNIPKKKMTQILIELKENYIDEIQLSNKWLELDNKVLESVLNNFTDYEDESQVMWKVFYVNMLMETFWIPSSSVLEFYKNFSK